MVALTPCLQFENTSGEMQKVRMFLNSICDDDDEAGKDNKIVERFYFVFISFLFRFYYVFISFLFFSNPCALTICDDDEITKLESDLKHEVSFL